MTASLGRRGETPGIAGAAGDAWGRFWFRPYSGARVGMLRIWLFGFVFFDVLLRKEVSVAMADTPRLFWHPVGATWALEQIGIGPPNAWQIRAVQVTLLVAAFAAMIGYRYRLVAPAAALLYLYWQCLGQSWGEMKHARVSLVLGLLFLSVVAASERRSVDSIRRGADEAHRTAMVVARPAASEPSTNATWAVRAIQVAIAVLYFLSGYSKLRSIGIDWMWGNTLRQALQDKASSGETTAIGFWVLHHGWMLVLFQVVSLLWEVGFPLIFVRRLRYPVIIVGLLFNIGLWTTVRIEFFGVMACFAAFLPLDEWEQAMRRRWAARRGGQPIELEHVPGCARCAGDVSVALLGDWAHRLYPVSGGHVSLRHLVDAPVPARVARVAVDLRPGTPVHTGVGQPNADFTSAARSMRS